MHGSKGNDIIDSVNSADVVLESSSSELPIESYELRAYNYSLVDLTCLLVFVESIKSRK